MPGIVRGFETNTVAALATELVSRAQESMTLGAARVEERLKASASKYSDTGEMENSITVTPYGGLGGLGAREVGMIATVAAEHAEWVDKGVQGTIYPVGRFLAVGGRAPNRRNAPSQFQGVVTRRPSVQGQKATHWFSAPGGIPLNEIMRNVYAGIFRRLR